jgi:superfamily II DNA/RNA helicase
MREEVENAFYRIGMMELTDFQRKLRRVYSSTNKSIIIQAKNGVGKTIGTLYSILTHFDFNSESNRFLFD